MATYYVSPIGSNSYTGLASTYVSGTTGPWLTIGKAMSTVAAGDVVNILSGVYSENLNNDSMAQGTVNAPIVFQAYGDGPVEIVSTGNYPPLEHRRNYWTWQYITFTGSTNRVLYIHDCTNASFLYCLGHKGTSGSGVYLAAATDVALYNCSFAEMAGAIWLASASTAKMRNCIVAGINKVSGGQGGVNNTAGCTLDIDYCVVTGCAPERTPTTQIYNAGTLVDGGHNIINGRPRVKGYGVTGGSVKAMMAFSTDDYADSAYALTIAQAAAAHGVHTTHCVQASLATGHAADLQTLFAMGEEIATHSYDHPNLVTQSQAITIQYTGAAATCTATVSGGVLTLTSSNGGAENHTVTLSGVDLNSVAATVNGYASYTATVVYQVHNALALADVATHDIKAAYTLLFDQTRLTTYQITDSVAFLQSMVPGLTVTTFCYPGGAQDATVQAATLATGMLVGLGATSNSGNLASVSMYNLNRSGSSYLNGVSEADTRARARWLAEYTKSCGGIGAVENHVNAITAENVGYLFAEWALDPDVQVVTVAEMAAAIRADHTSADGLTWTKTYADSFDMRLQAGSPCIDAGVDVGLSRDILGNPIVGAPDIGAYEDQSVGWVNGMVSERTLTGVGA